MGIHGRGNGMIVGAVGLVVVALAFGFTPSAMADGGVNSDVLQMAAQPPAGATGVSATAYAALFAGIPADPPTGTIVADSGFRPFPNGFGFVNYGTNQGENQVLFGQPSVLASGSPPAAARGLEASDMRRVFGEGVCISGAGAGCTLTESAKVVMKTADAWAASGHCFGLATVANALFTGKLSPSEVRGGVVSSQTTLSNMTQRTIMRAFIAQYFSAVGIRPPSMTDAVSRIRAALTPGRIPITILIYGAPGGHALVPYALLDKGAGKFDVAVYDPNLPSQARAVHIDTVANSWNFTGSPELPISTWSSSDPTKAAYMILGDVNSALGKQSCNFCQTARSATMVSFSPVLSANRGLYDNLTLTDSSGNPLDPSQYRIIPPTDAMGSPMASSPVMLVDRGVNFEIGLNAENVEAVEPFTVTVLSRGSSRSLKLESINSDLRGKVRVGGRDGSMGFAGVAMNRGTATHTYEQKGVSYAFTGVENTSYHPEAMDFSSYQSRNRVVFRENDAFRSSWRLHVTSQTAHSTSMFVADGIKVDAGNQLVVTYQGWAGTSGRPMLWLDKGSNGSLDVRVPMHKV
jgi:hypothetical protein